MNLGALSGAAGATPPPGAMPDLSGTVITTTNFTDFGVPVSIVIPPASEVMTLTQMMQLGGSDSSP
ncbi:MAG: hypothetical protein ACRDJU_11835, partial [Actinomycetota bacterium]